jgi:cation transport ATPase
MIYYNMSYLHYSNIFPEDVHREREVVMAPLQKRAWFALGIALAMLIAWAIIFTTRGVTSFNEDKLSRLLVSGIWVGGGVLYAIALHFTGWKRRQTGVVVDERDRMIMGRAMRWQLLAVLGCLVAWTIALTEVYWSEGTIPIVFPNLVLMSALGVMLLAQAAGILAGYGRQGSRDDSS